MERDFFKKRKQALLLKKKQNFLLYKDLDRRF